MKPSDYIPHEPERNPLHEFICASVAACFASIYPRADPQRFVEIVNRTKAPACVEETLTDDGYCTRNGCDCPCCEAAHARLRAISYARAEASPAEIHCATSECEAYRRDHLADARDDARLAKQKAFERAKRDAADEAHRIARESCPHPDEVVRAAAEGYHETDTGVGPAGTT